MEGGGIDVCGWGGGGLLQRGFFFFFFFLYPHVLIFCLIEMGMGGGGWCCKGVFFFLLVFLCSVWDVRGTLNIFLSACSHVPNNCYSCLYLNCSRFVGWLLAFLANFFSSLHL